MKSLICLCILVTFASAYKPCCYKKKWQAKLIEAGGEIVGGVPGVVDRTVNVYYDYDRGMLRIDSEYNGEPIQILRNHKASKQYTVLNGTCSKEDLTEPLQSPCIPDNATFMAYHEVGSASDRIDVVTWITGDASSYVRLTVTDNDCTPVIQTILNTHGPSPTLVTYLFSDIETGITDPTVFDEHHSCTGV